MTDLKSFYEYLIIGGGMAADKAARAIRKAVPEATIAILSAEQDPPVYRPALTKDLWLKDDPDPTSHDLSTVADTAAELFTACEVTGINPTEHRVQTATGHTVAYGRLLLATGSAARRFGELDDARLVYLRTVADYRRLRKLAVSGTRIAVVGGGYLGSEIAAGLSSTGAVVTCYFRGEKLLENMFPDSITDQLAQVFTDRGIGLVNHFTLTEIEGGDQLQLTDADGRKVSADVVVLGLGAQLNTELAAQAGLEMTGEAVVVDDQLRTSAPEIWAAGDIAHFPDPLFGPRHVEHMDNAIRSGRRAGVNMAGGQESYSYTPLFYSDLFDDGYEAIGRLDTRFTMIEDWNEAATAAVIYYLDGDIVRGILLWNTWNSVPAAREVIARSLAGELSPDQLSGQIPTGSGTPFPG